MKRLALASLTLSLALAVGCRDSSLPTFVDDPGAPLIDIVDGAHGDDGNPDFFFLPPIAPNPKKDPDFEKNEFNPNLAPLVQICDPNSCPDNPVLEEFATQTGQHYQLNW